MAQVDSSDQSSELRLRLISAGIGLPILGLVIFLGFWPVTISAIVVSAVVALETRRLAAKGAIPFSTAFVARFAGAFVASVGAFAAALGHLDIDVTIANLSAVAIGFIILVLLMEIAVTSRFPLVDRVRRSVILSYGAFVLLAVTMLPFIISLEKGREILTFCILVVFAADTGAYFIGKAIGQRRIAPEVSPGKTWEGLAGGIVSALFAAWALSNLLTLDYTFTRIVATGLAVAIIGVTGDLGESWIKRLSEYITRK